MQNDLFEKWLKHYDPIHRGYTPRGIANGVCATNGWFFPRVRGGYNLYRGTPTAEDIDEDVPVGAAGFGAVKVSNFAWWPHAAGTECFYALRAIGGGGVESDSCDPPVSVAFDAAGNFIGGLPNSPTDLSVSLAPGGRFVLRWTCSSIRQETPPVEFRIHSDGGTGTMDYETVVGQVAYDAGQVHFNYTSDTHAHGTARQWGVRAVSKYGREDGNQVTVRATADAVGPDPHPNLLSECVED